MCVCVCEQDLELNNLQVLICHKIQPTKDGFGIKQPTMVDMPLNKENKPNPLETAIFFNSAK